MWPYLPSALCICARGRTGDVFSVGGVSFTDRMSNVSNVVFYEKRVADCCSKLDKACCSAKALPRCNLTLRVEWIWCSRDLTLHTILLLRPTSDPLPVFVLQVMHLWRVLIHSYCILIMYYSAFATCTYIWTYAWNSFLHCIFVFHHVLSL